MGQKKGVNRIAYSQSLNPLLDCQLHEPRDRLLGGDGRGVGAIAPDRFYPDCACLLHLRHATNIVR